MRSRALKLKPPLLTLAINLGVTIAAWVLIGPPGPCGFNGVFGDKLAQTSAGDRVAMLLDLLPLLGMFCALIWIIAVLVTRGIVRVGSRRANTPPIDPGQRIP